MTEQLTNKEKEILSHVVKGLSNKEIGRLLNVKEKTIKGHMSNILHKKNVNSRCKLIVNHYTGEK